MSEDIDKLVNTINREQFKINIIISDTVELVVGSMIHKLICDGKMAQLVKIAQLRNKITRNRKRCNPKSYTMWSAKQSCIDYVEYDGNDR